MRSFIAPWVSTMGKLPPRLMLTTLAPLATAWSMARPMLKSEALPSVVTTLRAMKRQSWHSVAPPLPFPEAIAATPAALVPWLVTSAVLALLCPSMLRPGLPSGREAKQPVGLAVDGPHPATAQVVPGRL